MSDTDRRPAGGTPWLLTLLVAAVPAALSGGAGLAAADGPLRLEDRGDTIALFREGGDAPLVVQNARKDFRPYLHPIRAPDGQGVLTQYSPGHHKHQTGLYWGFTRVNGRDYFHHPEGDHWRRAGKSIEEAAGKRVSWTVAYDLLDADGGALLTQTHRWSCVDGGDQLTLDLHWSGRAAVDVTIARYKYGGLFLRMPWSAGTGGAVMTSAGRKAPATDTWEIAEGHSARWVDVGMPIEGRSDWGRIAIFDHRANDGFPTPWRVDGELGVGPCRARLGTWSIKKGETAELRHRLVVYTGDFSRDRLEAAWSEIDEPPQERRPDLLVDVFRGGPSNIPRFRIPALVTSNKGTLLAFCEAWRTGEGDTGTVELALRRSTDGGKSWSAEQVVWSDGVNTCGNPCPVVDRTTGRIWLAACWNRWKDQEPQILRGENKELRRVFVLYSDDDGVTWSEPRDITDSVRRPHWRWYATGPGKGIQLTRGKHAGRLVIPANHSDHTPLTPEEADEWHGVMETYFRSHVFYSDDHGETWKLGGVLDRTTNESTVVELSDGAILDNMRSYYGINRRAVSVSRDGGDTWSTSQPDPALVEPVCQGNILRYSFPSATEKSRILFSNPASLLKRGELTVRLSYDEGKTWPVSAVIYAGSAAYSVMTVLDDGSVGVLFERDDTYKISFAKFSIDWLENG